MSVEQGYHLNVAEIIPQNVGKPFGPYHRHYCRIFLGDGFEDSTIKLAQDIAARFPVDQFKCDLTKWESRGYRKEF